MVMGATLRPFIGGLRASPMRERPTQSASLCLSVSLPLHPCISEWFLSRRRRRNTLLRRQLKKKQAVLLDASSLRRPHSALRLRRLPLPSSSSPSHRRQPTRELARFEQVPQASRLLLPSLLGASAPALRLPARGGGQDPEIRSGRCLASAAAVVPPRGRPGAIFGRPWYVFLSGLGFGCAALRQRLPAPPRVRWVAKKGRREREMATDCRCLALLTSLG